MKKTATLVAGLLLVSGTVFAAGNLDFAGSVIKAKTVLISTNGMNVNDDSNGDTDYNLHLKYTLDDKTSATFTYTTDDNSNTYDNSLNVKVKRVEGTVEAQISAELATKAANGDSVRFTENQDTSDTYIKWNKTKDMALTFYPFNMGLNNGSVFDNGDSFTQIPGVVATIANAYVGVGMDAITTDESVVALKAGYTLTAGPLTAKVKYSGVFYDADQLAGDDTAKVATAGRLGKITNDVNANVNFKLSKALTLDAEVGVNTLDKDCLVLGGDSVDSGFGLSAKATYAMTSVLAPYAQVKYTTDGFLAYGDMRDQNKVGIETGGIAEGILGANYTLAKNLVLNGEAVAKVAGEKIYTDSDNAGTKSSFTLAASVAYTF